MCFRIEATPLVRRSFGSKKGRSRGPETVRTGSITPTRFISVAAASAGFAEVAGRLIRAIYGAHRQVKPPRKLYVELSRRLFRYIPP